MKSNDRGIEEDLDFGCEERSEDQPVMAVVILEDPEGNVHRVKAPDAWLYEKNINRGSLLTIDAEGKIEDY